MNFLEICQSVLGEADKNSSTMTDVTGLTVDIQKKVVRWVQQAYGRVQRHSHFWKFHFNTGLFITTSDGVQDYTKANVRDLQEESLKVRHQSAVGWSPLRMMPWEEYQSNFKLVVAAEGQPVWIIPKPDATTTDVRTFRLYPTPSDVFEVWADWYSTNDTLSVDTDEPIWHEDFHDILVWMALSKFASEYEVPDLLDRRIKEELPPLMQAFYHRYLPQIREAAPLMGSFR
jgi:hypothetical protein